MHLFSFENEEDKETGINKCNNFTYNFNLFIANFSVNFIFRKNKKSQNNTSIISFIVVESLFCPMTRLTTISYAEKWKSMPKTSENKLVIVINLLIF